MRGDAIVNAIARIEVPWSLDLSALTLKLDTLVDPLTAAMRAQTCAA